MESPVALPGYQQSSLCLTSRSLMMSTPCGDRVPKAVSTLLGEPRPNTSRRSLVQIAVRLVGEAGPRTSLRQRGPNDALFGIRGPELRSKRSSPAASTHSSGHVRVAAYHLGSPGNESNKRQGNPSTHSSAVLRSGACREPAALRSSGSDRFSGEQDECADRCSLMGQLGGHENEEQKERGRELQGVATVQTRGFKCVACLRGWAVAAEFVKNDAAIMKRELLRLDSRAREDVERLRNGVHSLDARARADAGLMNSTARQRLRRIRSFALGMEEAARMELLQTAEQHRTANGALMADLQIADVRARRRALEDAFAAWQVTKQVHESLVRILRICDRDLSPQGHGSLQDLGAQTVLEREIERGGRDIWDFEQRRPRPADMMERWHSSSVLRAVLGLQELEQELEQGARADPEELEFLLAALLDLDEVSEGSGALLLAQQLENPDVATRQAIVNVLAAAPSLWALGNAGMGALQRLSKDDDPAVSEAAKTALSQLWDQFMQEQDNSGSWSPQ